MSEKQSCDTCRLGEGDSMGPLCPINDITDAMDKPINKIYQCKYHKQLHCAACKFAKHLSEIHLLCTYYPQREGYPVYPKGECWIVNDSGESGFEPKED